MKKVSKQQIQHIAFLAKLELTEAEIDRYEKEFNQILEYVSQIEEVDTTGIELEHNLEHADVEGLRADEPRIKSITKEKMLQNATDGRSKNGYVRVSKIVDKGA